MSTKHEKSVSGLAQHTVAPTETSSYTVRRGVKALLAHDGQVLLVKERHSTGEPFWTLPGGGVEPGESKRDALHRELREELNCQILPQSPVEQLVYVHSSQHRTATVYTVIECGLLSDLDPSHPHGVLDARWVPADAVPARTLPQIRVLCERLWELPTGR